MSWLPSLCWRRLSKQMLLVINHHHHFQQAERRIVSVVSSRLQQQSATPLNKILRVTPTEVHVSCRDKSYQPSRDSDFKEIYRFRYIFFTRLISNMKVYQTGLTVLAAPFVIYFQSKDYVTEAQMVNFLSITSFACIMLYIMSDFFRRIVCVVYVNEKKQTVEISHLTFWARRRDVRLDMKDIKPLSDTNEKTNSTFVKLQTYSKGHIFYLFLNHGHIKELESLKDLLGLKTLKSVK